jgi:pimeloyl-ACP methyl ester carboxylesterase
MRPTVIYVSGAFVQDTAWWFHRVDAILAEHGIESRAVNLTSCGPAAPLGDLHDDANALREVIAEVDGPIILVGHSYGGQVITEAGAGEPKVRHLVYVSGPVEDGVSLADSDYMDKSKIAQPELLDIREDGTVSEGSQRFKTNVLIQLDELELVRESLRRLTRQSLSVFTQEPQGCAWKEKPSTYILCLNDEEVDVQFQRPGAERCTTVVEVPTNHFPHLERPDLVADVLLRVATEIESEVGAGVAG